MDMLSIRAMLFDRINEHWRFILELCRKNDKLLEQLDNATIFSPEYNKLRRRIDEVENSIEITYSKISELEEIVKEIIK